MLGEAVFYTATAAVGIAWLVGTRTRPWRAADPKPRIYWAMLTSYLTYSALFLPPVAALIGRLTGIPNSPRLLADFLAVAGLWGSQQWLHLLGLDDHGRGDSTCSGSRNAPPLRWLDRGWLLLAVVGAGIGLFTLGAPSRISTQSTSTFVLSAGYRPNVAILAYSLVVYGYCGLIYLRFLIAFFESWRDVRLVADPVQRVPFHFAYDAFIFGWLFNVYTCLYTVARFLIRPASPPNPDGLAGLLLSGFTMLLLLAYHVPLRTASEYYALWRLGPLWRTLCETVPRIARSISHQGTGAFRLHRRVTEIWDGIAALHDYRDPRIAARAWQLCHAAELTPKQAEAIVEAAVLAGAIRAHALGQPVPSPFPPPVPPAGHHLGGEIGFLIRVGWALHHSQIVAAALAETEDGYDAPGPMIAGTRRSRQR